jgi:hypothetical protein
MSNIVRILIGFIIISSQACQQDNHVNEIRIYNELLPELIDFFEVIWSPPPPPPTPPSLDSNDSIIGYDTSFYKAYIEQYYNNFKQDTVDMVIAIFDSLFPYHTPRVRHSDLPSKKYIQALDQMSETSVKSIVIDLNRLNNTRGIELRYTSEFPEGREIWSHEYEFNFQGVAHLSRISLDSSGKYGIFYCSYSRGPLWGGGHLVFVKKMNGKWVIEKMIGLWVS